MDYILDAISRFAVFEDSKILYFRTVQEVEDMATPAFDLELSNNNIVVKFSVNDSCIRSCLTALDLLSYDKVILCYDFKNIVSCLRYRFGRNYFTQFNGKIFDLKVISAFLSTPCSKPVTFYDAVYIFKEIVNLNSWKSVYKNIHFPLMSEVIPGLETRNIIVGDKIRHSFYEIEGQTQGRLSTRKINDNYIVPHSMNADIRNSIKPNWYGKEIICLDYSHMEVSVLQWLSRDLNLKQILDEGDFYSNLYSYLFGKESSDKARQKMKMIFLPLVYGAGIDTLQGSTGIDKETLIKIVSFIKQKFSSVFQWLDDKTSCGNTAIDYFGRRRTLDFNYQIRNFLIQSPAAMICQHKLIVLYEKYKDILFNIHDGYVVIVDSKRREQIIEDMIFLLEKGEGLYPGLKLKVAYSEGLR